MTACWNKLAKSRTAEPPFVSERGFCFSPAAWLILSDLEKLCRPTAFCATLAEIAPGLCRRGVTGEEISEFDKVITRFVASAHRQLPLPEYTATGET